MGDRETRLAMRGLPERLGVSFSGGGFEMRARPNGTPGGQAFEFTGYATVYGAPFDMWDQNGEPFTETVAPGAAKRSLARPDLDVPFLVGHNDSGVPLARTKSGTMRLSDDSHGVHVHVPAMDGRREEVRALASAIERGDLDEMSLAFICTSQQWDAGYEHRTVLEMDLHRGDVCAVTHGANPATAGASMRAVEQLGRRRPVTVSGTERRSRPQGGNTMNKRMSERLAAAYREKRITHDEVGELRAQAEQLEARAGRADELERRASLEVHEPGTYAKDSPHSFFADIARVHTGRGDVQDARRRLDRHDDELAVFYPAWRESRRRAAHAAYEAAFGADRRGQELLEQMDRLGLSRFRTDDALAANYRSRSLENRAISTTPGAGGYFTPPLWLLEDWAQAPRAGRGFADLWTGLPLPPGCHSVNIPKWTTGLGAGPATDGSSAPADSPADSFSTSAVVTVAGTQLVSMQFAEQTAPPGYDAFIFADLMADIGNGLDVQLLIGSGSGGQLAGILPSGGAGAASLVTVANSNAVTGQTITTASAGAPYYRTAARMLSLLTRARGLPPTHVVIHPSTYWQLAGTIDTTGRPLVPLDASPPSGGPAMVCAWGRPALLDDNLPITFGGATAPSVSANGGGVTAATAGNGTWAVVTAIRAPDLYLFEGEMRVQVAQDVPEGGTLQWRFVAHQYAAALRDRYVAASTLSASAETDSGSVTAMGATTCGVATHYQANSPMQPAAQGY